jgi:hypothetical protein
MSSARQVELFSLLGLQAASCCCYLTAAAAAAAAADGRHQEFDNARVRSRALLVPDTLSCHQGYVLQISYKRWRNTHTHGTHACMLHPCLLMLNMLSGQDKLQHLSASPDCIFLGQVIREECILCLLHTVRKRLAHKRPAQHSENENMNSAVNVALSFGVAPPSLRHPCSASVAVTCHISSALLRRLLATYTPALLGMQSTVWGDSPHAA